MIDIDWNEGWDEGAGLWARTGGGHTRPVAGLEKVHPGPDASSRLLLAAQAGRLDRVRPPRILAALRSMQTLDGGERHGCLKWYLEEPGPTDTNAAFFTALGLIPLRMRYADALDVESRDLLDRILGDLRRWFDREAEGRSFYYPNKFLGDLVCAWLLGEIAGNPAHALARVMDEAAAYWLASGWGWGEHMSDGYSRVCLDELSVLLLFSRRLPADLRGTYGRLLADLLAIDDSCGDGPRVPAIRSYSFLAAPNRTPYRRTIRPLDDPPPFAATRNMPHLGPLFHEMGWERIAPPPGRERKRLSVPCHGGTRALGWIAGDMRVGVMDRFPVMPNADHAGWGLSWQSMPAAFWTPAGTWGFWQWETEEDGRVRAHPAAAVKAAYLGNALTETVRPPVVGRTHGLMKNGNILLLRVMPAIPAAWDRLTDRLRVTGTQPAVEERPAAGGWSQLIVRLPARTVAAQCVPLNGRRTGESAAPVAAAKTDPAVLLDWELTAPRERLGASAAMVTLWGLSVNGPVSEAPVLAPWRKAPCLPRNEEHSAWELTWRWPGVEWRATMDPLDPETPMRPRS